MALKDILVHLDDSPNSQVRLQAALELARSHGSQITGLYAIPRLVIPTYVEANIPASLLEERAREMRAMAEQQGADFEAKAAQAGCPAVWRCSEGEADAQLNEHARYTDLVMVGQADDGDLVLDDHIILGSARPVLIVPYIGLQSPMGEHILVAWNGSREAVRAVHDAMAILQAAKAVEVVVVDPSSGGGKSPSEICAHLRRHGVNCQGTRINAKNIGVGDALLGHAADKGSDLIVMGAYGHTRLRETIFGGITRHLLKHMTIPTLMSH